MKTEGKWEDFFKDAPVGVYRTTLSGDIAYVNDTVLRILGYSDIEELRATSALASYKNPDDRKALIEELKRSGKVNNFEVEIFDKSRKLITVLISAVLESDSMVGMFMDITAVRKTEQAFRELAQLNSEIIEDANEGIVVFDREFRYIVWNPYMEKLTGFSRESVLGKTPLEIYPHLKEPGIEKLFKRVIAGETVSAPDKQFPFLQTGRSFWVSSRYAPHRDGEGNIIGAIAFIRDITDRKKAEEDLKRSNKNLEQFASVVTHDLREPLRSISTAIHYLKELCGESLPDKASEFMRYAVEGSDRMDCLILDLFKYSTLAVKEKEFSEIDCEKALIKAVSNLSEAINKAGAKVDFDNLPPVFGNELQLMQLFQNLIANAIKFHGDETPQVYVSAQKEGNMWRFSVSDNGIGIDPKHSKIVFEIFRQLHPKNRYPGTGIGLAICKKIVEQHQGEISFESEPGQGATFYFTIPEKR